MKKYFTYLFLGGALIFYTLNAQVFKSKQLSFRAESIQHGLGNPWSMVWFPETSSSGDPIRGLIAERNGGLVLFDLGSGQKRELPVPTQVYQAGQGGLLDLALDPDFSANGWIYLTFSFRKGLKNTTALARFKIVNQKINSFQVVFEANAYTSGGYHYGSRLVFPESSGGSKGVLYMGVGDRNLKKPAQDTRNHVGKVIRFNYRKGFNPEVYSYGHRNPQGMVWDTSSKNLLAHEHGARGGDEINIIRKGKNYGWPIISYGVNYDGSKIGEGTSKPGMEQPMYYWDPSIAPSGFAVYQGKEFSEWEGDLLVGSLKFGLLVRLKLSPDRSQVIDEERLLDNRLGRIRYVGVNNGKIYLLTDSSNGKLYRLTRSR